MAQSFGSEQRTGRRYLIKLPVRAEWDIASGEHIVSVGETENVGPMGALVHLERLPDVGSRVNLTMLYEEEDQKHGEPKLKAETEVLRLEHNPAQPLAALQLLADHQEWRDQIWEPSAPENRKPPEGEEDDEFFF